MVVNRKDSRIIQRGVQNEQTKAGRWSEVGGEGAPAVGVGTWTDLTTRARDVLEEISTGSSERSSAAVRGMPGLWCMKKSAFRKVRRTAASMMFSSTSRRAPRARPSSAFL